jgi:membrane-associated phospholipid phosphatase
MLILAGFVALSIDLVISRPVVRDKASRSVHKFLGFFEPFGQPTVIVVTTAAIVLCGEKRRSAAPRLLAAALGSGLAADVLKLLVARTPPHHHHNAASAWSSFQGLFPGLHLDSRLQSCPSAHTATAVGFALALWTMFPAGRWLFVSTAALVALQRVEAGAHYVSDVCWGAATGYAVCTLLFQPGLLGRWFDRRELNWSSATTDGRVPHRQRFSIVSDRDEPDPPE